MEKFLALPYFKRSTAVFSLAWALSQIIIASPAIFLIIFLAGNFNAV